MKRKLIYLSAAFITLLLISAIGIGSYIYSVLNQIDIRQFSVQPTPPTVIYDRNNQPITELTLSKTEPIPFNQIPKPLIQAILSVEDRRFYEHIGIDWIGIVRAGWVNFRAGEVIQGGSSITQQLVKNAFLTPDQTLERKIQEAFGAVQVERKYSKDQILEQYLNTIYFGEGAWGVQRAATVYFGKEADQLTVAESALLAALPKAPSHYSPFKSSSKAVDRRNLVLSLMEQNGFINQKELIQAKAEPLPKQKHEWEKNIPYPSFIYYLFQELKERHGISDDEIWNHGLQIYTTLDPKLQQGVEKIFEQAANFPASPDQTPVQGGAAVIQAKTGEIQALMAGRGKIPYLGFHRGVNLRRQPGSTMKPLMVYGPALEAGYTPDSLLYDGPLNIAGYQPQNWDRGYHGKVTLQQAVQKSWNIPAVWLLNEMGIDKGLDFSKQVGIPLEKEDRNLGVALGGMKHGASPLHMAQAYAAFANHGQWNQAYAVRKVLDQDHQQLVSWQSNPKQVLKASSADLMTYVLQGVIREGTGRTAQLDRPVAGKTGTTELPSMLSTKNGVKDAWFVGYTPQLSAAVWLGYDAVDSTHYLPADGGQYSMKIWKQIMNQAHQGLKVEAFPAPPVWKKAALIQSKPKMIQTELMKNNRKPKKKTGKGKGKHD